MRNETRLAFNAYLDQIARLNGVPLATQQFSVEPTVQQRLEIRIQETSAFLSKINLIGVPEQRGETLKLGVNAPIAATVDTNQQDRLPADPTGMDPYDYFCAQTNFDTAIKYSKLDAWAKFPDFQTRLRDVILMQQGRDRMMIGFNGTSRAATSDPKANPLLQDVNVGWLQKFRDNAPTRVLHEVKAGSNVVQVGQSVASTDGYKNLDALVFDVVHHLIAPWFQDDPELVVILGRNLLADKYFPLLDQNQRPVDQMALDLIISQKRVGGLQAVGVPFFPANGLLVTRLDNLSIYWQENTRRRMIFDNARRDRIENFESVNEAYVVENYDCGCLVDNIQVMDNVLP